MGTHRRTLLYEYAIRMYSEYNCTGVLRTVDALTYKVQYSSMIIRVQVLYSRCTIVLEPVDTVGRISASCYDMIQAAPEFIQV
jgi:hypothetical protein